MANVRYPEDYDTYFSPNTFLERYKNLKEAEKEGRSVSPFMKILHEFWSSYKAPTETAVRYLEFGGGPSVMNLVFACPKVDHIVFAEYAEANRKAVKSWIAGDADAFDWTPLIEIAVLELQQKRGIVDEKNGSSAENLGELTDKRKLDCVLNRADAMKSKIKSIVPCDVNKAPIVQLDADDIGKPFDVVSTSLCLESCVLSEEHYKKSVAELCRLLKQNGCLFMNGALDGTFYFVGEEKFYNFPLTEKMVKESMIEAKIEIEEFVTMPANWPAGSEESDCTSLFYTYGRKSI